MGLLLKKISTKIEKITSLIKKWRGLIVGFLAFWLFVKPASAKAVAWVIPLVIGTIITLLAPFIAQDLLGKVRDLTAWVLIICAQLLSYVLSPQFNNMPLTHGGVVDIGLGITREMANILFVMWMVVIAFSTIFDIEDYGAKKRFVFLITIALLINFSQVIVGIIVDMSQVLMNFFIGQGLSPETPLAIAQAMRIDKLLIDNPEFATVIKETSGLTGELTFLGLPIGDAVYSYGTKIFSIFFLSLAAHIFLLIAAVYVARTIAIWIITILSPIAFSLGIMPFGSGWLKTWWSQLFSWSFIGVSMSFFLYLAARLGFILNDSTTELFKHFNTPLPPGTAIPFQAMAFLGQFSPFLIFITIFAFLKIAHEMAKKTSAMGADAIIGTAERYLGKIDTFFKNAIKFSMVAPFKAGFKTMGFGVASAGAAARGVLVSKGIPQAAIKGISENKYLMSLPLAQKAVFWAQDKVINASGEAVRKHMHDYGKLSAETQIAFYPSANYEQKIAIVNNLADQGKLNELKSRYNLTNADIKNLFEGAKNIDKKLASKIGMADLTAAFGADLKAKMEHIATNPHLTNLISKTDLEKPEVAIALKKAGVEKIIRENDLEKVESLKKGLQMIDKLPAAELEEYAKYLKTSVDTLKKINETQKKLTSNVDKWTS